jgi:hypothetical protein
MPTAARDAVQQDKAFAQIQDVLGNLVIRCLTELAVEDRPRFEKLMEYHHYNLKGMAVEFDDFFDAVADLMIFECNDKVEIRDGAFISQRNRLISMKEYIDHQRALGRTADKSVIVNYFREAGATSQYYRLCQAKGLLVLSACAIFEEQFLQKYERRRSPQVALRRIDIVEGSDVFEALGDDERKNFLDLEYYMSTWLRGALPTQETTVTTERFAPESMPALITETRDYEIEERFEKLSEHASLLGAFGKLTEKTLLIPKRRRKPLYVHLNASNRLVQKLSRVDLSTEFCHQIVSGLYNNALVYSSHVVSPETKEILYEQFNQTLEHLIAQQEALVAMESELRARDQAQKSAAVAVLPKTPHVSVFIMMPFDRRYDPLEEALRQALETPPLFFQVTLARDATIQPELLPNVRAHMQQAHAFIAEISEHNPNVMFELGAVAAMPESRPTVVLRQAKASAPAVDIQHLIFIDYDLPNDPGNASAIGALAGQLRSSLARHRQFAKLRGEVAHRYLSPLVLGKIGARLSQEEAEKLSRHFTTIEALLGANEEEVEHGGALSSGFGRVVKAQLDRFLAAP